MIVLIALWLADDPVRCLPFDLVKAECAVSFLGSLVARQLRRVKRLTAVSAGMISFVIQGSAAPSGASVRVCSVVDFHRGQVEAGLGKPPRVDSEPQNHNAEAFPGLCQVRREPADRDLQAAVSYAATSPSGTLSLLAANQRVISGLAALAARSGSDQ